MAALSLALHWCRVQDEHNRRRHAAAGELDQAGAMVHCDRDPHQAWLHWREQRSTSPWTWVPWEQLFSPRFQVEAIDLSGPIVDANQWRALRYFPEVRELAIRQSRATHVELAMLGELCGVQRLILDGAQIDNDALAQVAKLTDLRALSLQDTPVDDAGIAKLVGLRNLSVLHLDGTAVTDRAIEYLKQLPSLTEVRLYRTQVTPAAITELDGALPLAERCHPSVLAAPLRTTILFAGSIIPNPQP